MLFLISFCTSKYIALCQIMILIPYENMWILCTLSFIFLLLLFVLLYHCCFQVLGVFLFVRLFCCFFFFNLNPWFTFCASSCPLQSTLGVGGRKAGSKWCMVLLRTLNWRIPFLNHKWGKRKHSAVQIFIIYWKL